MSEEPTLEYLAAQLRGQDPPPPSFNPNGFRSLDADPPKKDAKRDRARSNWESILRKDDEMEELYLQLQRAQRLCRELEVAGEIIKDKISRFNNDE